MSPDRRKVHPRDASDSIIARASRVAAQRIPGSTVVRRLALLVFDSNDGGSLVGARATALRPRRMLFESGMAAVDLEIRSAKGRKSVAVIGQIRLPGGERASDVKLEGEKQSYGAAVDEQGMFELEAVRTGEYAASIHFSNTILEIPELAV